MRALVVYAHPSDDSLSHTLYLTATKALEGAGHDVVGLDLYAEDFIAAMSAEERAAYHSDQPVCSDQVARSAELVRWADTLVFVYPTWWMGTPAILKGWLERVMVPGVALHLDPRTHRVVSDLTHVRRIVGVTTYGSGWAYVKLMNDAGRRTLLRALRMLCGRRCRSTWLAFYGVDTSTAAQRAAFLSKVEQRLAKL
jgi:putative NADPH-quinone reductase